MSTLGTHALSILVACLVILVVLLVRKRLSYFSSRRINYVKPTWISFFKSFFPSQINIYPQQIYDEKIQSNNSIIGYFQTFLAPVLLVLDSAMARNVLIKDFSYFHDHGVEFDLSKDPLVGNLFNLNGDQWKALRNKLMPTFTSGKLKGMIPAMEICAQSLIKDMKQDISLRQDVNIKDLIKKFTVAVIASCVFGIDPDSVKDADCEYQRAVRRAISPPLHIKIKQFLMFLCPKISKVLNLKSILKFLPSDVDDFYINLTKETMETRKRSGIKKNDFIQLLLELKEKGSVQIDHKDLEEDEKELMKRQQQLVESDSTTKLEMSYEVLAAQVFVFIAAGFDSSSYLVAITAYMLSKHKDIQQRVREEVRAAKSKHGGINFESLKDMRLLEASFDEALRLHPPIFSLFRVCTKNYTLSDGGTIDVGTTVLIPVKLIQNDSRYWRNPEQFIPERFLTDEILPGTYMPFGDGPRLCIGKRLAYLMGKIVLAELIDNYALVPSQKTTEPIQLALFSISEIEGGLWGHFLPLDQ